MKDACKVTNFDEELGIDMNAGASSLRCWCGDWPRRINMVDTYI